MAGILANSVSKSMASGTADAAVSGYLVGEEITLTTLPTGTEYAWTISKPSDSTSRADLSDDTGASVRFSPDVEGYYVVTCTVDSSTVYILRIAAVSVGVVADRSVMRFSPLADSQVPTPATGVSLYYSSTQSSLAFKTTAGAVYTLDSTAT